MTSWHEIVDPAIYSARRFTELSASEGTKPLPYLDTNTPWMGSLLDFAPLQDADIFICSGSRAKSG